MNDEKEKSEAPKKEPSSSAPPQSGVAPHEDGESHAAPAVDTKSVPPKIVPTPISSSPIVISADSFPPPSAENNAPPSTIIENAMMRGRAPTPLSTIIGIGFGVFVVLVGLTLLLFFR